MKRSNTDNEFIKGLKDQISLPSLKLTNPQISVRAEPLKSTTNPSTLPTKRGNIAITLVESDDDSTSQERKKHEKVKELKKNL